jgi:hypothetical protein
MEVTSYSVPHIVEKTRKVIMKGKCYQVNDTIVMALETTCSLTKETVSVVIINKDPNIHNNAVGIMGSQGEFIIKNLEEL